jgi:hypothetical protein
MKLVSVMALGAALSCYGSVIGVSGDGVIMTPNNTPNTGATANFFQDTGSNVLVRAWNEQQNVTLGQAISVDLVSPGTYNSGNYTVQSFSILAGTTVSSHLLYFDPAQSATKRARFEFDSDILGLIVESGGNASQDKFLKSDFLGNPLTTYPGAHYGNRGIEFGPETITLEVGLRFIDVSLTASNPGDQIRVITAGVPEPATFALIGGGLLLAGLLRRRQSR